MSEAKLDPLTVAELDELERLEREASPGEWRPGTNDIDRVFIPYPGGLAGPGGERVLLIMNSNNEAWPWQIDARLIAAARNALPRLIAAAREATERSDYFRACNDAANYLETLAGSPMGNAETERLLRDCAKHVRERLPKRDRERRGTR